MSSRCVYYVLLHNGVSGLNSIKNNQKIRLILYQMAYRDCE